MKTKLFIFVVYTLFFTSCTKKEVFYDFSGTYTLSGVTIVKPVGGGLIDGGTQKTAGEIFYVTAKSVDNGEYEMSWQGVTDKGSIATNKFPINITQAGGMTGNFNYYIDLIKSGKADSKIFNCTLIGEFRNNNTSIIFNFDGKSTDNTWNMTGTRDGVKK